MVHETNPLIIGVDGMIGRPLWHSYRSRYPKAFGTSRNGTDSLPHLDLRAPKLNHDWGKFTHGIIAGAMCNIRECEMHPSLTYACNVSGPLELGREMVSRGIKPVFFSTDYVFDGMAGSYSEQDIPSPINEYGRQRAELEERIPEACSSFYLIVRLTKVFPYEVEGRGLLGEMASHLLRGQKIRAAEDQVFSPILLEDVIKGIAKLMDLGANGLYQIGGPEAWTRYDLAKKIAECLKVNPGLVEPISLDDLRESFRRPKKTNLLSHKFEQFTGIRNRGLSGLISELYGSCLYIKGIEK